MQRKASTLRSTSIREERFDVERGVSHRHRHSVLHDRRVAGGNTKFNNELSSPTKIGSSVRNLNAPSPPAGEGGGALPS